MQIEAHISDADAERFSQEVVAQLNGIRPAVQEAMADAYYDIVTRNIGDTGVARPLAWPALSPAYAKRVGRQHATLLVQGTLLFAIKLDKSSREEAVVSVSDADCPYAVAHQYGYPPRNLPPRPYFPFDPYTGETTPYALAEVQAAAELKLEEELAKGGTP